MIGSENLKKRIISAIVMILIVLPLIVFGGLYLKIGTVVLGACSMYELLKQKNNMPLFIKIISIISVMLVIYFSNSFSIFSNLYFFPILFLLFFISVVFIEEKEKYNLSDALYVIGSIIFISISFIAFNMIREKSIFYFVYIILIATMTDTFALFGGTLFGKHKLCPKISPNKTIEGSVIGTIFGVFISVLFIVFTCKLNINIFVLILITLLLSIIGQFGDLFFSSIKRSFNIKDFSNLIPGHGGILDRLDSLIFISLTYILFMGMF